MVLGVPQSVVEHQQTSIEYFVFCQSIIPEIAKVRHCDSVVEDVNHELGRWPIELLLRAASDFISSADEMGHCLPGSVASGTNSTNINDRVQDMAMQSHSTSVFTEHWVCR